MADALDYLVASFTAERIARNLACAGTLSNFNHQEASKARQEIALEALDELAEMFGLELVPRADVVMR